MIEELQTDRTWIITTDEGEIDLSVKYAKGERYPMTIGIDVDFDEPVSFKFASIDDLIEILEIIKKDAP